MFEWPDAALAHALSRLPGVMFVDASGGRLERLAAMARAFAPGLEVIVLPAWDASPYDRTPASAAVIGQRVAGLARLAEGAGEALILTSVRALLQRTPSPAHWRDALLCLQPGDAIEVEALRLQLAGLGYGFDERVDRPGEVAIRGQVIDVFGGAAEQPVRVEVEDGRVASLHRFDPMTQRTVAEVTALTLRPVVEAAPPPERVEAEAARMADPDAVEGEPDVEPAVDPGQLGASLFDYVAGFQALVHPETEGRAGEIEAEIADAFAAARSAARSAGRTLPKPAALYLTARTLLARLAGLPRAAMDEAVVERVPVARDLAGLVAQVRDAPGQVMVAGDAAVARALQRRGVEADCLPLDAVEGFRREGLTVLATPPALLRAQGEGVAGRAVGIPLEEPPRLGDLVVHEDHGVCRLSGLRLVGEEERLALKFREGTELLVPVSELSVLWRYGSEAGGVTLDRLHGDAWHKRRAEIGAEIEQTAAQLAQAAAERAATKAPVIAPGPGYARVVERFAFALSPDQEAAIEAVLADLKAGRPMDRLVCGDVGFGKTEVALRAAAAAALAGWQVAIVAPTTVLARQHLDTFRRRLAGTGVRVEPMLRGAAASKDVRAGLADGSVGIVVGTQAIAADSVRFARLGLVVIDEEQRFGDADKRKLATLKSGDEGAVHVLVMTATPIPRTLQAAMVGLRDVSVIATAPVRRQPTRTFVLPWGEAIVREALVREHARGGQSFVVAPRIDDLAALEREIKAWAPGLSVAVAHGKLKPTALEELVAGFAEGDTDVLLATNIIEAGLDIPRANTILITGPHRFGLAQLHQMRGRVGRGARRGLAYMLTAPGVRLAGPTVRRLKTLETLEGLGAGVVIAMADMDVRGAGDLFGDAQAGHVRAIGTELYQHLLARALAPGSAAGRPVLHLEVAGRIPEEYVPESNLRLALYRRLARVASLDAVDELAAELVDRFGTAPEAVDVLLDEARLRAWCLDAGVVRVDAGPKATGLTLTDPGACERLAARVGGEPKGERVLLAVAERAPHERLRRVLAAVGGLPGAENSGTA